MIIVIINDSVYLSSTEKVEKTIVNIDFVKHHLIKAFFMSSIDIIAK